MSHLRRVLGGNSSIVTRGRGYELPLPGDDVDAVRFERLVEKSRAREALALSRGDALSDVAGKPFAAAEIRRLDALRQRAAEVAIDADMEAGRHAEVIGELEGLVAAQPLAEACARSTSLALYRCGRRSDALAASRSARAELVEESGSSRAPSCSACATGSSPTTPRSTRPRPPSPKPSRRQRRGVPAAALTGAPGGWRRPGARGHHRLRAHPRPRARKPPGHRRELRRVINPDGWRIAKQIPVGDGPSTATDGGRRSGSPNAADGTVSRIDRKTNQAVRISVGGAPAALAYGGGSLWVADSDSGELAQIDSGANKVAERTRSATCHARWPSPTAWCR